MLNQHHPVLTSLDTFIEPLINRVVQSDKLVFHGGSSERVGVDNIASSCGKLKGDRFILYIPYARQNLIWNVFFDSQCPEIGPDFVFNDDTFLSDLDVDTLVTEVPSLAKWNPNDKDALVNVLLELLLCYKRHQVQLIKKQDRLQFEYSTLVETKKIKTEDVEVIMLPPGSKPNEARFIISLSVDLSKLLHCIDGSKCSTALLIVTFYGPDWFKIVPQLILSKSLEDLLGGANNLHLPPFPGNKALLDYVPEIKKFITDKVNMQAHFNDMRIGFITTLLRTNAVVEYDATTFNYIVINMEKADFEFLVYIHLSNDFPNEKPKVELRSLYHMTAQDVLYSELLREFPYHRQWEPQQMVQELLNHILNRVAQKFKNNCSKYVC